MLRQFYVLAFGFFIALLMALPLAAAQPCAMRADVVQRLAQHYGETPRAAAITADQMLVEIFAAGSGSWTIVTTQADGRACLLAAGHGARALRASMAQLGSNISPPPQLQVHFWNNIYV